ncbi:MAG TPA: hypothetical protein EYG85_00355 [Crocinitomix sp.]|nr:hypothetical protein [Crocinitomix sp.]
METLKNILIDSLNGFSANDIPLFIFQILVAGLLAHIFQIVVNKKLKTSIITNSALIATTIAILSAIVKYSLPFSILALAIILWLKPKQNDTYMSKITLFIVGFIGVGCGVGSVILTIFGTLILLFILLFMPLKNNE